MSFVDIAFLEKGSIKDGQLIYKRKKTGKELRVAWRPCMQEIADRHPSLDGKHLLGIVNQNVVTDVRKQYHYRQCRVNKALQKFTRRIGIPMKVTMYCASHSKFSYLLNISELSILKNVTANDLETSYILFLSQLCNIQRTL